MVSVLFHSGVQDLKVSTRAAVSLAQNFMTATSNILRLFPQLIELQMAECFAVYHALLLI